MRRSLKMILIIVIIGIVLFSLTLYSYNYIELFKELNSNQITQQTAQQMLERMAKLHDDWIIMIYAVTKSKGFLINTEVLKIQELLFSNFVDKEIKVHLYKLVSFPWENIFSSSTLSDKFEVTFIEQSYFWSFFYSKYIVSGWYFPGEPKVAFLVGPFFACWTETHMRFFMFLNLIDPLATQMYCFKFFGITPVQYDYIVHTESFIKASELFLQNNLEVIAKAKEFYNNNNQHNLVFLWIMYFQGFPVLDFLNGGMLSEGVNLPNTGLDLHSIENL